MPLRLMPIVERDYHQIGTDNVEAISTANNRGLDYDGVSRGMWRPWGFSNGHKYHTYAHQRVLVLACP